MTWKSRFGGRLIEKRSKIEQTEFTLSSPAFDEGGTIPAKYTCQGENISPPLSIAGVPSMTRSLALIVDDPDAPDGTWVHWLLWNIDPKRREIAENSQPADSVEGITSTGKRGYNGPCPPYGTHRYFFKLYALDTELDLAADSGKEELEQAISDRILAKSELIGLYGTDRN